MSASPTMQSLFGDSPFITSPAPGGTGPSGTYLYNPTYFATPATAILVAAIVELGCGLAVGTCKIVEENSITPGGGPFSQNMTNQMIVMPDGSHHNAGLIANQFATNGSIETTNSMLTAELGLPFTYTTQPLPPIIKPVIGVELMVADIGKVAMQADGTYWKRVKDATGV
jgi:hypothetical protein